MKYLVFLLLMLGVSGVSAAQKVRKVAVLGDQIVTVRTSPSIATIIQLPDFPRKVVVGNLNAFKVEYLDSSIGIKTFATGVKSNLYIYTEWKRYNVELVSGSEQSADYVIYLGATKEKPLAKSEVDTGIRWVKFYNVLKNERLILMVGRLGRGKAGILLIEFKISGDLKGSFKPEWLWLTQGGITRPIHNLFLSNLEVSPSRTISGVLQLKNGDVDPSQPLRLEMRMRKNSYLTIKKVNLWK